MQRSMQLTCVRLSQFKPMPHAEDGSSFKGMQLLGFTDAKTLPLHLNLRSADYVLPIPMKNHPSGLWSSGGTDPTTAARCEQCCARASGVAMADVRRLALQVCCGALFSRARLVGLQVCWRRTLCATGAFAVAYRLRLWRN